MCGIYLTVSIGEDVSTLNQDELTVLPTPPPDWLVRRGPDACNTKEVVRYFDKNEDKTLSINVTFYASVLQMRDTYVAQPVEIKCHDPNSFIVDDISPSTPLSMPPYLAWNGEIYEYYNQNKVCMESVYHSNVADTKLVSQLLFEQVDFASTTTINNKQKQQQQQIANVMGQLTNAEYAFCIVTEHCVFYGRDALGRRSLLTGNEQVLNEMSTSMTTETYRSNRTIWELASVAVLTTSNENDQLQWQEVEPGLVHVYPIRPPSNTSTTNNSTEYMIIPPIQIPCVTSNIDELSLPAAYVTHSIDASSRQNEKTDDATDEESLQEFYCQQVHDALLEAVRRRCYCCHSADTHSPSDDRSTTYTPLTATVAVLFSGGLDSTVIAALALEAGITELMLLTVSFIEQHITTTTDTQMASTIPTPTTPTTTAADAIAAEHSYQELCRLYPLAKIHLIHRIVDWEHVQNVEERIRTLAYPKTTTVMDVNIATALWFAASAMSDPQNNDSIDNSMNTHLRRGQSPRVVLSGLGADELMGGYGRHRIAFTRGGYEELQKELQMDMNRLWERNLGRDDRILSDTSKEVRFPFLDPNVTRLIQSIPLQYVVDYTLEGGVGDKRILRLIAQQIGLSTAATAVKRAIQFGSRISHVSDKRRYGSRRKANAKSKS